MRLFLQWLFNVWNVLFSKRVGKEVSELEVVSKLKEVSKPTGTFFKPTDNIWQHVYQVKRNVLRIAINVKERKEK